MFPPNKDEMHQTTKSERRAFSNADVLRQISSQRKENSGKLLFLLMTNYDISRRPTFPRRVCAPKRYSCYSGP